ncbi:23S rRNA accumulation protein YceD [Vibrio sp. Of7-15]|uniref:23S rRNA accumulation protein YceD n=1 Tax=Vibrio sp. Of7-15 TaxID=2724879 RepID=UPI001EF337F8|nr:23S rRNA accumulation protein YceD [Vibrio sp. Of7-15]MCG7496989.1 23S rRNA accumulation protein YceD [Vibrio sp. Of7-15]
MQKVKLPRTVDPARAAQKRLDYDGIIQSSLLKRLAESTEGVNSDAEVTLSFKVDEQRLIVISGKANVNVSLECQRCNENYTQEFNISFAYTPFYNDEKAEGVPEEYDFVELNEFGELDLIELIEDEFMLALPQVAMHDEVDCQVDSNNLVFGEIPEEEEKPNPFDVLKNLKQ